VFAALTPLQQLKSIKNQMNKETDAIIMLLILVAILVFDCIKLIFSVLEKGIMKDRRELLMKKSKAELKSMLVGVKGISKFNKPQLVELLLV
tara:strand:- start:944 stop:1219 length:276 start_codon:yes stop_codon:yes gene_type:complete